MIQATKEQVAWNSDISPETLSKWSKTVDVGIREEIARSSNTPPETLAK